MSSSTSKIPESSSDPKDLDEQQASRDEISDQLKNGDADQPEGEPSEAAQQEGAEEEEGEYKCPFCLYMKGGACKDAWTALEKCADEAYNKVEDGGVVEGVFKKYFQARERLQICMDANLDYYGPVVAAAEQVTSEIEAEQRAANEDYAAMLEIAQEPLKPLKRSN